MSKIEFPLVTLHLGAIDPESLEAYAAVGGYASLKRALTEMTSEAVLEAVDKSGLRGRGGGGFPTGRKWRFCREAPGEQKFIICNGSEGDPGAFLDRAVMEGDPHAIVEGMAIGAYAMGAGQGFIYVGHEYPLAATRLRQAITAAREKGFLGDKILGTPFSFDIQVRRGAGANVCGEETALINFIQGNIGEP
ncbi:MAG: NADH-quinone oxidoreductase subunit F, partial [Deltaproteobacteria bacterium]|nr:NADH-quinone oxidoreductase subunit F [Deltaproteobacteria bacterium]